MSNKLDKLEAELINALALDTKRTAGRKSAAIDKAKDKRAALKLAEVERELTRAELAKSDWRADNYAAHMSRMSAIQADIKRLTKEGAAGDALTAEMCDQSIASLRVELSVLYGLPIQPRDLGDNGRFAASVRYHSREVGMLAADALDVVQEAVTLCYLAGDTTEVTRFTASGPRVEEVPTIGGMYRNLKRANHKLIDESRRMVRQGLIALRSLDELAEAGIEVSDRFESWGIEYADPADIPASQLFAVSDVDAERAVLAIAKRERDKAAADKLAEIRDREAAVMGSLPANVDTVALRLIINGMPVEQVAEKLGITRATLTRRLLALEPAGTRWTRIPDGEYGEGVEVIPVKASHDKREGWHTVAGVYASPVVESTVGACESVDKAGRVCVLTGEHEWHAADANDYPVFNGGHVWGFKVSAPA